MKTRPYFACFALVISAGGLYAAEDGVARQAITAAKAAQQQADALQGGWISTDTLIEQAEQAAVAGDYEKALALAEKARNEAERARAQAEYEKRHWSPPPYAQPK